MTSHVALIDALGTIVATNAAWRRFYECNGGAPSACDVGVSYFDVCERVAGEDSESAREVAAALRALLGGTQDEFLFEYPCHSPDEQRWFLLRASRLRAPGPPHVVVAHDDITARKLAELEAERTRGLLEEAERFARVGGWDHDEAGGRTWVSVELARMHSIGDDEPQTFRDFVRAMHPDDRHRLRSASTQAAETGAFDIEYRVRGVEDRDARVMRARGEIERGEGGAVIRHRGAAVDVTDLRQLQSTLTAREREIRALVADSPAPQLIFDASGVLVEMNDAACALWNLDRAQAAQAIGRYDVHADTRMDELGLRPMFARVFAGEPVSSEPIRSEARRGLERIGIDPTGARSRIVRAHATPIFDRDGALAHVVVTYEDLTDERAARAEAKQHEARWRAIAESPFDWVVMVDRDATLLYVNREGSAPTSDLIGEATLYDFVTAEYHERIRTALRRAFEDQERAFYEAYAPTEGRYFANMVGPVVVEGVVEAAVIMARDVTAEREAHRELDRTRQVMQQAEMLGGIGSFERDLATGERLWSQGLFAIFGIEPSRGSLSDDELSACIHPDDRRAFMAVVEAAQRGGGPFDLAFRIHRRSDGRERHIRARLAVTNDAQGRPSRTLGCAIDVTDIVEREAFVRAIFEQSTAAIIVADDHGTYLSANQAAAELFGVPLADFVGMNVAEVGIIGQPDAAERYATFLEQGQEDGEITFVHPDGARRVARYQAVRVRAGFNVSVLSDITEQRRAEQSLASALEEVRALKEKVEAENIYLRKRMSTAPPRIVAESAAMKHVLRQAERVATAATTVLVLGETGTGKEVLARLIHEASPRRARPMVTVNCAAMPADLIESELFGHERGAFTGAHARRLGHFELAHQGTLFLDEIGELSPGLQVKLLRVLEEGTFQRVGGVDEVSVDVRIIAATNRDLEQMVRAGRFRSDLFFRLNVFPLTVPPLRDRPEDIGALVRELARDISEQMGKRVTLIPQGAMDAMTAYAWPGNVRELRNVVERAVITAEGGILDFVVPSRATPDQPVGRSLADVERSHILRVLREVNWRVRGRGGAAEILGMKPSTLESRMKRRGIERPKRKDQSRSNVK